VGRAPAVRSETTRQRTGKLSRAEMLFIMVLVLFHLSPFKHFKAFYHQWGSAISSRLLWRSPAL